MSEHNNHPLPLAMKVPAAMNFLGGIGRSKLYELVALKKLRAKKFGKSLMIETASMIEYANAAPAAKIRSVRAEKREAAKIAAEADANANAAA